MLTHNSPQKDLLWRRESRAPIFTLPFTSRPRNCSTQRQQMTDSDPDGVGVVACGEFMAAGAVGKEAISRTRRSLQSSLAQWEYSQLICTMWSRSISYGADKPPWTA